MALYSQSAVWETLPLWCSSLRASRVRSRFAIISSLSSVIATGFGQLSSSTSYTCSLKSEVIDSSILMRDTVIRPGDLNFGDRVRERGVDFNFGRSVEPPSDRLKGTGRETKLGDASTTIRGEATK